MFPYPPVDTKVISRILESLPLESYLELALTRDQFSYWCGNKLIMLDVADHWRALHTGNTGHLHSSNDYYTQKIWLVTVMWQRLWEMTIACFPACECLAELLNIPFPFDAPVELFAQILAESVNGDFEICLQPYIEISSGKAEEDLRWLAKNPSFDELKQQYDTKPGKKKLERMNKEVRAFLRQSGGDNFWLNIVSLTGLALSRHRQSSLFIKSSVEAYNQSIATLAKLDAKQRHTAPSTCWHNGVKKRGNKDGTYSEHKTE